MSLLVVGHLQTSSKAARDQIIAVVSKIAQYAQEHEPNTLKYCITVPRDTADETTIYVIEEYADKAAFDAHMATSQVGVVISLLTSTPELLAGAGEVLYHAPAAAFTRPTITAANDPFIVFATLEYKSGSVAEGLQGWKDVLNSTEKTEPGTYAYVALKDNENTNKNMMRMFEVYESEKYLWETHCKSEIVAKKLKDEERLRARDPSVVFLKAVAGYLYKKSERAVI